MSKSIDLKRLYEKIELVSTNDRLLLARLKNGNASQDEINELLDIIRSNKNGGIVLDEIIAFEKSLVSEIYEEINALEEMGNEYIEVAHWEDEFLQKQRYADMKRRYKMHIAEAEGIIDALKVAYFQIENFHQYEERLYNVKEPLSFFD